ncbi:MAG: hypothetical protein KF726_02840 [Anaerolineae bacterium]|nr:hypothetical protein [Anaerolineae bacterium]
MSAIRREILDVLENLDPEEESRVLEFVRNLRKPQGIRGDDLIARAHEVNFDPADLEEMARAIEEGYR